MKVQLFDLTGAARRLTIGERGGMADWFSRYVHTNLWRGRTSGSILYI